MVRVLCDKKYKIRACINLDFRRQYLAPRVLTAPWFATLLRDRETPEHAAPRRLRMCNCSASVDLSCLHPFKDAYFHRLNNCFFPVLHAFVDAALQDGCIYAETPGTAPVAEAFLQLTFRGSRAQLFSRPAVWDKSLNGFPVPPTRQCKNVQVPRAAPNREWAVSGLLSRLMQIKYMTTPRAEQYSVLVLRQKTRRFANGPKILKQLRERGEKRWLSYFGTESVKETLKLFSGASAVLGYHGAGLLNVVFSRAPVPRVHELTTFVDLEQTKKWRSYIGGVAHRWNTRVVASTQAIPLKGILEANRISVDDIYRIGIKNVRFVRLTAHDVNTALCYIETGHRCAEVPPPKSPV